MRGAVVVGKFVTDVPVPCPPSEIEAVLQCKRRRALVLKALSGRGEESIDLRAVPVPGGWRRLPLGAHYTFDDRRYPGPVKPLCWCRFLSVKV
jgi:hypothetical protein